MFHHNFFCANLHINYRESKVEEAIEWSNWNVFFLFPHRSQRSWLNNSASAPIISWLFKLPAGRELSFFSGSVFIIVKFPFYFSKTKTKGKTKSKSPKKKASKPSTISIWFQSRYRERKKNEFPIQIVT
jgi:hypothetical protein